jgi:ubiquinone/menaquinone biosynthesis C-methylase UbiE
MPYAGIRPEVASILSDLIQPEDDYHYKHARRFARTLEVILDQKPFGKFLELGTSGVMAMALKELVPDLEIHVTEYSNKPSTSTFHGDFPSYHLNLEKHKLPVEVDTFDFVSCCEVVEHLEQDPMFMFQEINRISKTKATLILTTPNITSSNNIAKMLRCIDPYFYMQYRKSGNPDRHNYEYSLFSISKLIKSAGFTGSGWTEDTFDVPNSQDILKLRGLGYSLPHIGDNIFCVAKKNGPVVERYPAGIYED